jgi:TIGR00159 family protein
VNIDRFLGSWSSLFPRNIVDILTNLIEVAIIAYIVYIILLWIKNTRAWQLLKGLVLIFAFTLAAAIFRFDAILWILSKIATIAVTALIIIFQPELRRALEQLGSRNFLLNAFPFSPKASAETHVKDMDELIKASFELAACKTGALIVIERDESLQEFIKTGIKIDAAISSQLLINIFEHNTPLHDGAVIIVNNRIDAATCYLPLSENSSISKALGTRHRAAIGISEVSDSVTIVVSEETGRVSVAYQGRIIKVSDSSELRNKLVNLVYTDDGVKTSGSRFGMWKMGNTNERKIKQ